MRARGGGRGGRGGFRSLSGLPRTGPTTEETPLFPPNPSLEKRNPRLTEDEQKLVALNRILINYWKYQSPFQVQDKPESIPVQTYSAGLRLAAATDPQKQRDLIISLTGAQYFPEELLTDQYRKTRVKTTKTQRRVPANETEKADGSTTVENANPDAPDDEESPEVDDFGGDDYAHDHYADEDMDEFDEGGGEDEVL